MKIYNSTKTGSTYWLRDEVLMFAPTPIDGLIDFDNDGGEVEFNEIEEKDIIRLLRDIEKELNG